MTTGVCLAGTGTAPDVTGDGVRLDRVRKDFGRHTAVADLSLAVARGEFVCLLGPSGCGKTTTLRMIAGFVEPTAGEIFVNGRLMNRIPPYARSCGMVFQSYALFPHLSAFDNVAYGLVVRRLPRDEVERRGRRALAMVRMAGWERRYPKQLSGGQQQRIALARALVIEPSVLLLDEPLSNLDARLRVEMREEVRALVKSLGITAIFVTHDQEEALTMADRIVVMNHGRIEQVGSAEDVYERPRTAFVARFVGSTNLIEDVRAVEGPARTGSLVGTKAGCRFEARVEGLRLGEAGRHAVSIRPEKVNIARATEPGAPDPAAGPNRLAGVVSAKTYMGPAIRYRVTVGEGLALSVDQPNREAARCEVGERVVIWWDARDALVVTEST